MGFIRNRAAFFAAFALLWHVVVIAAVSTAISCDQGQALEHAGLAGHEGMANCPMQKGEPACPLHGEKHGTHDCDCPTLGCSQTDAGITALFGAIGILPTVTSISVPFTAGAAAPVVSVSAQRLAVVPLAPPPRT